MKTKISIFIILWMGVLLHSKAQTPVLTNLRTQILKVAGDSILIDSLSLIPESVTIDNVNADQYTVDYLRSMLIWKQKPLLDSITITYRVFSINFYQKYFHKDVKKIETNFAITPYYYDAIEAGNSKTFIDFGNVDYAGSFGRALSFGNSQDVVLNSQFNLQFDGDLGDSIQLTGAITDNNIPFQPQGNTQQIQEFDKMFIQLRRKNTTLIAGDYDIKKPNGYFMNFYKRVQGVFVANSFKTSQKGENKVAVGASLAKGKFVRNILTALEGNQGPYKLTGPNGEQFFIVLAGTERVYIDGVLMSRGEDLDYVIDYNAAEIVFMPRRLITKDLRMVVEFEFADRNYLNSLIYVNDEWQVNEKLKIRLNVFSNQDAKNQSIQQSLDSTQKRFLGGIGDSIQNAFYPSVSFQDTFSSGKILYKKIDTLVNAVLYQDVYIYSTNKDSAKYYLSFSSVGAGNGNYTQSINNANGRVYAWKAPINGIRQGDYEPVIVLVTPKKQQLLTAGLQYQIDSNKNLIFETGISDFDPNTFSKINNETHKGVATKLIYDERRTISKEKGFVLNSKLNYEFVQDRFRPLERFRNVEFTRDWNVNPAEKPQNEHLGTVSFSFEKQAFSADKSQAKLGYQLGTYLRGTTFKGFQHLLNLAYSKHGYRVLGRGDWIQQEGLLSKGNFFRPYFELEKQFSKFQNLAVGSRYLVEHNALKSSDADTLLKSAFSFDALTLYVKNSLSAPNSFNAEYTLRRDRAAKNNEFRQSTLGNTFALNANITSIKNQEIKITGAYRILKITDSTLTALTPDESLLGRLEYNFSALKGLLSGNLLYELGSGQELKREFTYVKVVAGQGQYVWRDYNKDSVEQLNEFELAIFNDEKLYVRIFTPTSQYVKAKYSVYNQAISINPKVLLNQSNVKGLKKLISLFYFQSAVQLNNRFIGQQGIAQYNPFIRSNEDTLLLNQNSSIINSIFLNRFNNNWGLDYVNTFTAAKTLMTYGVDTRRNNEHLLRSRVNISRQFTLGLTLRDASRSYSSMFLENRNFLIFNQVLEPNITWVFHQNQVRIQSGYKLDVRKNHPKYGGEVATANNINFEIRYNIVTTGSINVRGTYTNISYNGVSNSSLGYTMLDGLQNGKNYLWQINFDKRVSKNIEMSLQYEGRKPASTPTVHTGKATVRAIF